jgi:DNA-binding CsgD family transcriptional regulator/DNA-binding transcriptional ArsR family regulator
MSASEPGAVSERRVFVGRAAELARVSALLDTVGEGRAGGLFVLGEAGVGKSRLLAEAATLAADRGVRVATTTCLQLTTPLPLDPVLDLSRSLGQPVGFTVGESPRDVFWAVVERLEQASVAGPLLLCLDDMQWSDAATIDLVHYCLARLRDIPIAWMLAARPERSQTRLAHRLEREGFIEWLSLDPLSVQDTALLAEGTLGVTGLDQDLIQTVYERAGGNPFLSVQLLRAGARSETVAAVLPATVTDAIDDRAARLSAAARSALAWAAVLPEPFTFGELEAVGGATSGGVLEELEEAGLLVSSEVGGWRFVHSIIRDAVYDRLSEQERTRRHGAVADALAGAPVERLAPQLERARRWGDAAPALIQLAEAARNRGEGEDAAQLSRRAGEYALRAGNRPLQRRAREELVLALLRAGDLDEARREASALRSELRTSAEPGERLRFLSRFALGTILLYDSTDLQDAREALEEAQPLIDEAGGVSLAEALAARAMVSQQGADSGRALIDAERAAELARVSGDSALEANALVSLGLAVGLTRSLSEGTAILERGLELASAQDLSAEAARARLNLSHLSELGNDAAACEQHARLGLELAGVPLTLGLTLRSNLSESLAERGDLDAALAHQLAALRQAERVGPQGRVRVKLTLAHVQLCRGDLAAARRQLEGVEAFPATIEALVATAEWGALLEEEGAVAEARERFQEGATGSDQISMLCLAGVARTAVAQGDVGAARVALARLNELGSSRPGGEWLRDEIRAWIAVGEGCPEDAVSHFHAGAAAAPHAYDSARLGLEAARHARDREQIDAAIQSFQAMGAAPAADRARAIARGLGMRPGRQRRRAGALSAREQEVAQLVAVGQTNAEIAAGLYISPRTVERHVSNILTKLGYRSRVEIAKEVAAGRLPGASRAAEPLVSR